MCRWQCLRGEEPQESVGRPAPGAGILPAELPESPSAAQAPPGVQGCRNYCGKDRRGVHQCGEHSPATRPDPAETAAAGLLALPTSRPDPAKRGAAALPSQGLSSWVMTGKQEVRVAPACPW